MLSRIMINVGLKDHPKLHGLAKAAGISWATALGYLVAWWSEVMIQRESGVLEGWSTWDVERASGWPGKRGTWVGALLKTGWLDQRRRGKLFVHDWEENQGAIIGDRMYETLRKRVYRAHKKGVHDGTCPNDCPGLQQGKSAGTVPGTPAVPLPSLPSPSHPSPALPLPDAGQPPGGAAPETPEETREIDRTVGAFGFCGSPNVETKQRAVRDLRRLGVSHEWIRKTAGSKTSSTFWEIIRFLEGNRARSTPKKNHCETCGGKGKLVDHEKTTHDKTAWKPCPGCEAKATG